MKKRIASIVMGLVALPGVAVAAGGGANLMHMDVDYSKEALRDGAKTFVNNCMGCHNAKYFRLKNLVKDLGMDKSVVEDELMYGTASVNDHMMSSMAQEDGEKWFGAAPPDLSLVTRVRGSDWVYSYLLGFYPDHGSATGWNNQVFPMVSMPNVMVHMTEGSHGYYTEDMAEAVSHAHSEDGHFEYPEVPEKLDGKVQNLVSFLTYVGDPSKLQRASMGPWVIGFLVLMIVLTYLVKKEYWRDIH